MSVEGLITARTPGLAPFPHRVPVPDRAADTGSLTIDTIDRMPEQELLRHEHARLAATFEHAGIGIVEIDADGILLRVNPHLCELMGYTAEELLGRSIFDDTNAEDVEADRAQFRRQLSGEIASYTIEKRIRRKDGSYVWISSASASVRDEEGRFLYAVRVQRDISDRKQTEASLTRRMEEQAALYELTAHLQRTRSLEQVFEPALDAIFRALRCQRAAVLLFDNAGVMRFAAFRGLSERYRQAVEGHSPWDRDSKDPEPICIDDIERADLPEALKQTVLAEGIRALAFIPLQESGRLVGKFMTYYDEPHEFTSDENDLAVTIARQLGFAAERQRAERAMLHLASIVEFSDDAIVSKDLNGIISTWNRGAERLFGYTAEEAVGKPVTILIPLDRHDEEPGILARLRRGERIDHYETVRQRKDGTLLDISLTVSPMRDSTGRIIGASKIARNITEQKRAEARLRESERRLQELLGAIPAAIYTTDAHGRVTYYNQAAAELAGREPVIGSDEWCVSWKLFRPDGTPLPHDECPMAVALKEGRTIRDAEAVLERPDGVRIPFIPYPTPLRNEAGELVGAINMLVDISERRHAETQQRILLNELNHRVKNNMQMLQSLLYTAARQTRNAEAKAILADASGRIAAMAAAQRVLYGTLDATRFSARDFVEAVCESARQAFPAAITVDCEASPDALPNDSAMPLALILNELLTNAMKHGLNGKQDGTIRVRFAREAESFVLSVEDDGLGFDLDAVRDRSSGLRLVLGLARQVRGHFTVTREPFTRCILRFA